MSPKIFAGAILLPLAASTALPHCSLAESPAPAAVRFTVTVDRGEDLGQCFGSLFEAAGEAGGRRWVLGAGFPNAYNTRYRADRHSVQFFLRPADGGREFRFEELPRPTDDLVGAYLFERDGTVYSTYGGLRAWDAEKKDWSPAEGLARGRRGTGESMRVGDGVLAFGDSRVMWNGETVLDPPGEGGYELFFYANGHLCFYHVHRNGKPYRPFQSESDGYSRLYACPWSPGAGPIDLSQAATLRLPVVGETTFAWGQLRDQIVTGSNIGGFYVFQRGAWRMLLKPTLNVSYQLYSTLAFRDTLLMGQYPTGRLFSYDGNRIVDQPGWPPVMQGVSDRAREAQTTTVYGGDILVGVWPWGEVWRLAPDGGEWHFLRRMFEHPQASTEIVHPYDKENQGNAPGNLWGQRVTSLVPAGADLFIATSAKSPQPWQPGKFPFLAPQKWKDYGKVYRATTPGHLSAPVAWTRGPTKLEFAINGDKTSIRQDGRLLAEGRLPAEFASQLAGLAASDVQWGEGLYGSHGCQSVTGVVASR